MNTNNYFLCLSLSLFFALSPYTNNTLLSMEQHHQEETEQLDIENSAEQSIVALNVMTSDPDKYKLRTENPSVQNPASFEEKLIFILERSSSIKHLEFEILQKLSGLMAAILRKADELRKQNFISFYHTRGVHWDFFSHIVKVCEEKKRRSLFANDTNFFAYNPERSNKILLALEKEYEEEPHLFEGKNNSKYGDCDHLKFPIRWLLTCVGEGHPAARNSVISVSLFIMSSEKNESALHFFGDTFHMHNKSDVLKYDPVQENFQELLERYGISDKSEALTSLYQKTFGTSYNTLYHIAIHKDLLDRCVLLTKEFAYPLEYCKGKLTSNLFAQMETEQGFQELSENFENEKLDKRNLIGVQARMFIDPENFTNPEKVKAYAYYQNNFGSSDQQTSFDKEAQNIYWQELRKICNNP